MGLVIETGLIETALVAFLIFASALALVASMERILGRPIPNLRYSRPVHRNRAFLGVPVAMAVVVIFMFSSPCNDCGVIGGSITAFVFSGTAGWIVFAALLIIASGCRSVGRVVRMLRVRIFHLFEK